MKHLLLTTIAAVILVGCGLSVDIWEAARTGNIEAVKQHIAAGADVNAKDEDGITLLHYAAWTGQKETVELLITNSAEVNAKDAAGNTPLDLTNTEIADLLREHGGSHGYLGYEFVMSILENRKPQVDIGQALNMIVAGVVAHQSAIKDGELMKIPQYAL